MGLLDGFKTDVEFLPYVNTGTLFDIATGKFQNGSEGNWVLNGGLGLITGIIGRAQTYKSSIAGSLMANALMHYPEAEALVYETEFTINDATRYTDFVSDKSIVDRIVFHNRSTLDLGEFFEKIKELVAIKEKQRKDYLVDTPFLNPKTGKPFKSWIPTFVLCDSWSKASSSKEDDLYTKTRVDESGMNMLYMQEGGIKTKIMRALPLLAAKVGIYVILTAHVGNKFDLDPYNKSPKQLQYMKNTDKIKNVGAEFEFLTTTLLQVTGTSVLQSSDKSEPLFPYSNSHPTEVNEVNGVVVRCKNNVSGTIVPYVVSQYQGILNAVTNFYFCKKNKEYGYSSSGRNNYSSLLYPSVKFNRTNIRELSDKDYKLYRAMELTAQLCFIRNYWSLFHLPNMSTDIYKLIDTLWEKQDTAFFDEILQTTGVWGFHNDRRYMSVLDVLELWGKKFN